MLKKVINIVCGDRPVGVVPPADRKFESPAAASLPPPPSRYRSAVASIHGPGSIARFSVSTPRTHASSSLHVTA
jgi:hypothetical protein